MIMLCSQAECTYAPLLLLHMKLQEVQGIGRLNSDTRKAQDLSLKCRRIMNWKGVSQNGMKLNFHMNRYSAMHQLVLSWTSCLCLRQRSSYRLVLQVIEEVCPTRGWTQMTNQSGQSGQVLGI